MRNSVVCIRQLCLQALSACYKLLSDGDRRAVYDESGEIDEEDDAGLLNEEKDWNQYWRMLFQKITVEDIKHFEKTYRHSEEEMIDLKQAYLDGQGDMEYVLSSVPCCSDEDQQRFVDLIGQWVEKDELPFLKAFRQLTAKELKARKRKAEKEEREAEELAEELGLGQGEDSLKQMIMRRQEARAKESDAFLDGLAAKYASGGGKKKGKKTK